MSYYSTLVLRFAVLAARSFMKRPEPAVCANLRSPRNLYTITNEDTFPKQIHPPSSGLVNVMGSPATIQLPTDDVKPLESEPSESAFTRRAGGTFAPRGGLLLQGPHEKSQVHHLMVNRKQTSSGVAPSEMLLFVRAHYYDCSSLESEPGAKVCRNKARRTE